MKENCGNCRNHFKLWKSDYSKGGCEHSHPDGYICMAFANEGKPIGWLGLMKSMECVSAIWRRRVNHERYAVQEENLS